MITTIPNNKAAGVRRALCVLSHRVGLKKKYFAAMSGCVRAAESNYGKSKYDMTTRLCRILNWGEIQILSVTVGSAIHTG